MRHPLIFLWFFQGSLKFAFAMVGGGSFWERLKFAWDNARANYKMQKHLM